MKKSYIIYAEPQPHDDEKFLLPIPYRGSQRGNQGAGRKRKNKKGAERMRKI